MHILVLVLVRPEGRGRGVAVLLGIGALGFVGAAVPIVNGFTACCALGDPVAVFYVIAWSAVAIAGLMAATGGIDEIAPPAGDVAGLRMRLVVAPAVAIVIGAVIIDAAWHEPMKDATALALGMFYADYIGTGGLD